MVPQLISKDKWFCITMLIHHTPTILDWFTNTQRFLLNLVSKTQQGTKGGKKGKNEGVRRQYHRCLPVLIAWQIPDPIHIALMMCMSIDVALCNGKV
jgi:hypothetical protein